MAAITKTEYISKINGMRTAPAGKTPVVNADEIDWAQASTSPPPAIINVPSTIPANAVEGDLPTTAIVGDDIRDLMAPLAQAWSRVRIIKYVLDGNVAPAGSSYTRYAYVTDPVPATSVPPSSDIIYTIFDDEENIDLSDLNTLINTLKSGIAAGNANLEHTFTYCHSQCHSDCHASRGRR